MVDKDRKYEWCQHSCIERWLSWFVVADERRIATKVVYSKTAKKSVNAVDNNGNTAALYDVLEIGICFHGSAIVLSQYKRWDLI